MQTCEILFAFDNCSLSSGSARTSIADEIPCVVQGPSKDLTGLYANKLYYRFYTHYHTRKLSAMPSIHSRLISALSTNDSTTTCTSTVDGRPSPSSPPPRVVARKHASLRRAKFLRKKMLQNNLTRRIIHCGIEEQTLDCLVTPEDLPADQAARWTMMPLQIGREEFNSHLLEAVR
jgi:hypothetical protein